MLARVMVPIPHFLYLACGLFVLGLVGAVSRAGGLLARLVAIEVMLCGVHLAFVTFARAWGQHGGQINALAVGVIAAAHALVCAAILIDLGRRRANTEG